MEGFDSVLLNERRVLCPLKMSIRIVKPVVKQWSSNYLQVTASVFSGHGQTDPMEIDTDNYDPYTYMVRNRGFLEEMFNQLQFSQSARLSITREIIRLGNQENGQRFYALLDVFCSSSLTFTAQDMVLPLPHPHFRPLYVTTELNGLLWRRTLMDGGSTINIMPYSTFQSLGLPERLIVPGQYPIEGVSGVINSKGHVTVTMRIGEITSVARFFVMEVSSVYHLLLGREWMHQYNGIASTLHQCFKGRYQGREFVIKATERPYLTHEMHMADAYLYH